MSNVSIDTRYSGAWAEIQTRIDQRQGLFTFFITLALAVIGLATAGDGGAKRASVYCGLMLGTIMAATIITCILLVMHELMIHNLHRFCQACEQAGGAPSGPVYHSPLKKPEGEGVQKGSPLDFYHPARYARRWNDVAWIVTFAGANLAASFVAITIFEAAPGWVAVSFAAAALAVFVTVVLIRAIRHQAGDQQIRNDDDLCRIWDDLMLKRLPSTKMSADRRTP